MAPRPFFVSGGSEDPPARWKLLNHVRDIYAVLGFENLVGMHNRPAHPPTQEAMERVCDFFEHFLKNGAVEIPLQRTRTSRTTRQRIPFSPAAQDGKGGHECDTGGNSSQPGL